MSDTTLAFDIGGSKIVSALVDGTLSVTELDRCPTPISDYEAFCDTICQLVGPHSAPLALSIAGVVDPHKGRVFAANIPCLTGQNLRQDLAARLHRPVTLLNDAKAYALAEVRVGAAQGAASAFGVILGTGVGGAFVANGQLLLGATGGAGEWGHAPATAMRTGRVLPRLTCGCGQIGCLDTLGGARGLEHLYRFVNGSAAQDSADSFAILSGWEHQDSACTATVDLYLDIVGGALAGVVNTLDPAIVTIGGGLSGNNALINALDAEVRGRCLSPPPAPLCVASQTGPEKGLIGAAAYAQSL